MEKRDKDGVVPGKGGGGIGEGNGGMEGNYKCFLFARMCCEGCVADASCAIWWNS